MKGKKTVKGFINLLHSIEKHDIGCLNGFDKLSNEEQKVLGEIKAFIGNALGDELERFDKRYKNKYN